LETEEEARGGRGGEKGGEREGGRGGGEREREREREREIERRSPYEAHLCEERWKGQRGICWMCRISDMSSAAGEGPVYDKLPSFSERKKGGQKKRGGKEGGEGERENKGMGREEEDAGSNATRKDGMKEKNGGREGGKEGVTRMRNRGGIEKARRVGFWC
jgi:hypothetical protein